MDKMYSGDGHSDAKWNFLCQLQFCKWQGPSRSKRLTAVCSCYVRTYVRTHVLAQCLLKSPDCSVAEGGAVTKALWPRSAHMYSRVVYTCMHFCTYVRTCVRMYVRIYVCILFCFQSPCTWYFPLLCCTCCREWCGRFPRISKWRDYHLFVSRLGGVQFLPSNILCLRLFPTSSVYSYCH